MSKIKEKAIELIKDSTDESVVEIIEFIGYLKYKKKPKDKFSDLINASQSSISFWINKEDEVWNDV